MRAQPRAQDLTRRLLDAGLDQRHVVPAAFARDGVEVGGAVARIRVAHFAVGDSTWVAQSNGVHPYRIGEPHEFWLDVTHGLYFGPDGRRVA